MTAIAAHALSIFWIVGTVHLQAQPREDSPTFELFAWLANRDTHARDQAARLLAERGDKSMAPAFIEALRFLPATRGWHDAMFRLTQERLGDDWNSWMKWLGGQQLTAHSDYLPFKVAILERIDPRFADFFPENVPISIRLDLIVWGGVKVDGIPALDTPTMIPATEATYLEDDEPVFGIELDGDARAYPLRIMDWHEMANDIVGGFPYRSPTARFADPQFSSIAGSVRRC